MRAFEYLLQLRRTSKSREQSASSNNHQAAAPPPPPPNTTKPLPPPGNASNHHSSVHSVPSHSPHRSSSPASSGPTTPDRRSTADNASSTPPIVVVSPEVPSDSAHRQGPYGSNSERHSLGVDHSITTPPRTTPLNRIRGPKDMIPIVGKPPRKQRSSRFVVTEKVDIEKLPPFAGK